MPKRVSAQISANYNDPLAGAKKPKNASDRLVTARVTRSKAGMRQLKIESEGQRKSTQLPVEVVSQILQLVPMTHPMLPDRLAAYETIKLLDKQMARMIRPYERKDPLVAEEKSHRNDSIFGRLANASLGYRYNGDINPPNIAKLKQSKHWMPHWDDQLPRCEYEALTRAERKTLRGCNELFLTLFGGAEDFNCAKIDAVNDCMPLLENIKKVNVYGKYGHGEFEATLPNWPTVRLRGLESIGNVALGNFNNFPVTPFFIDFAKMSRLEHLKMSGISASVMKKVLQVPGLVHLTHLDLYYDDRYPVGENFFDLRQFTSLKVIDLPKK